MNDQIEDALYGTVPSAFWLRPDRAKHQCPCWSIEGDYVDEMVDEFDHQGVVRFIDYGEPFSLKSFRRMMEDSPNVYHLLPGETVAQDRDRYPVIQHHDRHG